MFSTQVVIMGILLRNILWRTVSVLVNIRHHCFVQHTHADTHIEHLKIKLILELKCAFQNLLISGVHCLPS